jgi:hypothetical protein
MCPTSLSSKRGWPKNSKAPDTDFFTLKAATVQTMHLPKYEMSSSFELALPPIPRYTDHHLIHSNLKSTT